MRKETFAIIRKNLAIFLAVSFLISVTAAVVCADADPDWTVKEKKTYDQAFKKAKILGKTAGLKKGKADGKKDCLYGNDNNGGDAAPGFKDPKDDTPKQIGTADGWNEAYEEAYATGYAYAYAKCEDAGQSGTKSQGSVITAYAYRSSADKQQPVEKQQPIKKQQPTET